MFQQLIFTLTVLSFLSCNQSRDDNAQVKDMDESVSIEVSIENDSIVLDNTSLYEESFYYDLALRAKEAMIVAFPSDWESDTKYYRVREWEGGDEPGDNNDLVLIQAVWATNTSDHLPYAVFDLDYGMLFVGYMGEGLPQLELNVERSSDGEISLNDIPNYNKDFMYDSIWNNE